MIETPFQHEEKLNFTKIFVTVFLVISLITTAYVFSEMNNNLNSKLADKYIANLELMSTINDSIVTNWVLENSKYNDFHFTTNCR
jgi:hypothetical protein